MMDLSTPAIGHLVIYASSGGLVGFALFQSRWFYEMTIGAIGAVIVAGLVVDGPDGFVAWVLYALGAFPLNFSFLIVANLGLLTGAIVGVATRRRSP